MTRMWPEPIRSAAAAVGAFFRPAHVFASRIWQRYFRYWVLAIIGVFPFTRTGVAFLALFSAAVYVYGLLARDLVLLVAGLGGGLILLVLLVATVTGGLVLFLRSRKAITPGELDLDTAIPQPTGYRLSALRGIPFIVVDWQWVDDGGGETAARVELERQGRDLVEMASPARRRIVNRVVRRFAVRDLFGLTEISWRRQEALTLRVLPFRGLLSQMPPPAGLAEGDDLADPYAEPKGDRVEMRQYAPGDPLRMVLWKLYARSGKMMVRTPERSVAERKRGCAYLVTSPEDDSTAAAARVAIERGLLGEDWCFAADGVSKEAREDNEAAFEIIARSGEAKPEDQAGRLATFLAEREQEGFQFCLLFIPPDEGSWRAVAAQAPRTASMHVQLLTAAPEIVADREKSKNWVEFATRWLIQTVPAGTVSLSEVRERATLVHGLATELIVAERNTGRAVNDMLSYKG